MPECQKAKMDLEPGIGGAGQVRSAGSPSNGATGGRMSKDRGDVPGILR